MANRTKDEEATLIAEIDQTLAAIQALGIRIPDLVDVREYLVIHPDLTGRLLQVCQKAKDQFAEEAQLSAEVYHDPEIDDQYLTVYVRPQTYELELINKIDQVQESVEDIIRDGSDRILIATDYRLPE